MGKIIEAIELVTSDDSNLENALLRCKVLARRLKFKPLEQWADQEISGYEDESKLPDYRRLKSTPRATLIEGNTQTSKYTLPVGLIDNDLYEKMTKLPIYAGVGQLISQRNESNLGLSLSAFEGLVNNAIQEEHGGFVGVRGLTLPIPPGTLDGVISQVRSKLVSFLLDLEEIFPEDYDLKTPTPQQTEEVQQAFTQIFNIHKPGNINIGDNSSISDHSTNINVRVEPGNVEDLSKYLRQTGLDESDIAELEPLLGYVYGGKLSDSQESQVRDWVESKAKKVGGSVAVGLIVEGLVAYAPAATAFLSTLL